LLGRRQRAASEQQRAAKKMQEAQWLSIDISCLGRVGLSICPLLVSTILMEYIVLYYITPIMRFIVHSVLGSIYQHDPGVAAPA
jgi:predicted thioredoxin/glutaredoxin